MIFHLANQLLVRIQGNYAFKGGRLGQMSLSSHEYRTEAWKFIEFAKGVERSARSGAISHKNDSFNSTKKVEEGEDVEVSDQHGESKLQATRTNFEQGNLSIEADLDALREEEKKKISQLMFSTHDNDSEQKTDSKFSNTNGLSDGNARKSERDGSIVNGLIEQSTRYHIKNDRDSRQSHSSVKHKDHAQKRLVGNDKPLPKTILMPQRSDRETNFQPLQTSSLYSEKKDEAKDRSYVPAKRKSKYGVMQDKTSTLVESAQRSTDLVRILLGEHNRSPVVEPSSNLLPGSYGSVAGQLPSTYDAYSSNQARMPPLQNYGIAGHAYQQNYATESELHKNHVSASNLPFLAARSNTMGYPASNSINREYPYALNAVTPQAHYTGELRPPTPTIPQQAYPRVPTKQGTVPPVSDVRNKVLPNSQRYRQETTNTHEKARGKRLQRPSTLEGTTAQQKEHPRAVAPKKLAKRKPKTLKRMDSLAKKYNLER